MITIVNYQLESIFNISFEEFFHLIDSNREYIKKGFSGTVKRCENIIGAEDLFNEWSFEEKEKRHFCFFIKEESSNELIGLVNVKSIDLNVNKCEIGYFISQRFAGKGIISKATSDVIKFCFGDLEMNKIFIRSAPENIGSQKIALKNGFTQEGILRQEYKGSLGMEDIVYFGLLKSEFIK
ncbi:MAG: GNAT family N-acetyltransferase [Lutibacter sp.]|nr:MAG: GNAT family N-acetyltransferase [Lutibacter sp.]